MWLCWRRSVPAPGQHFSVFRVPRRDLGQVVAALIGTLPLVSLASVSVREGECGLAPSDGLVTVLCLVPVPRACAEWGLLSVGPRRVSQGGVASSALGGGGLSLCWELSVLTP